MVVVIPLRGIPDGILSRKVCQVFTAWVTTERVAPPHWTGARNASDGFFLAEAWWCGYLMMSVIGLDPKADATRLLMGLKVLASASSNSLSRTDAAIRLGEAMDQMVMYSRCQIS
jgi:hypothetical protein